MRILAQALSLALSSMVTAQGKALELNSIAQTTKGGQAGQGELNSSPVEQEDIAPPKSLKSLHLLSYKFSQFTPFADEGPIFPKNSIKFVSSGYQEIMYKSPNYKSFGIQISAFLDNQGTFDRLKSTLNWGGIVLVGSNGSLEGEFNESGEAKLPSNYDPDELFQIMLPQEKEFKGSHEFYGVGLLSDDGRIRGLAYLKYRAPAILSVDTRQTYTFGENPRTGEFENYHVEGTYPYKAVDAEAQIEMFGFWLRLDSLLKSFDLMARNRQPNYGLFFDLDAIIGFAKYTPGKNVAQDYAAGTESVAGPGEGTTLGVNSSESFLSARTTYSAGVKGVVPFGPIGVGLSAGIEGVLAVNMFDANVDGLDEGESTAELFTETSTFGYAFFIRLGTSY